MEDPLGDHGLFHLSPASYHPDGCSIDIIAIHGLGGNAFKTWTESDGHLWLRDSLPTHVPKARVMTYGYDSAVAFGRSEMNVEDFALDLLARLLFERQAPSEKSRPILFICHSLGGVVLKQALVTASSLHDHYGVIKDCTFGVVFMGTPHRGSRVANQARHLARIINITSLSKTVRSDLLGVLSMSSKVLQNISQLSVPILKDMSIVSFYEQKPLGPTLIVESVSAILGLPNERVIPINTDHRKMAKVSPKNKHLFMPVWKAVAELAQEAMDGNAWQLKQLMDTIFSVDYKQSQLLPRQPHNGTTNWIFEHNVFNSWAAATESSFLWVIGPPGVGKSVLARHLVEQVLGGNNHGVFPQDYVGASFFCSYKDAATLTETDILRSLLHQLLQAYPQCQNTIRHTLADKTQMIAAPTLEREDLLWQAIDNVLTLTAMRHCFICIDALEELPSVVCINIVYRLYRLTLRFALNHGEHRLRVFITSRPMPDLERAIKSVYKIRMRSADVSPNISKYLQDNISDFARKNESFATAADYRLRDGIKEKIVERADGMFLYASIAWEDFRRGLLWNRYTVKEKIRQLDSAAPGINTLYDRMMGKVNPEIRPDMWAIFGAIATAERSLTEAELGIILSIQRSKDPITTSAYIYPFEGLTEIIETNFPELVRVQEDGNISFTHLSFKEYLFQYWSEKDPEWLDKARLSMAEACLKYLGLRDLIDDVKLSGSIKEIPTKYPFFEYAFNFHIYHLRFAAINHPLWLQYASLGSRDSIFAVSWRRKTYPSPLTAIIKHFKTAEAIKRFTSYGYDVNEPWKPHDQSSVLGYCFANIENTKLEELVLALLEAGADPNSGHPSLWGFETTMHLVIEMGFWRAYEKMIRHPQINLNLRNHKGQAAVHYMVRFADRERLAEFLQLSVYDINIQDSSGDTALHLATTYCELEKLKLILNVPGVRLNIQDNQGRTALTVASYWGLREAALALISHSKALPTPRQNEMSGIICAAMQEDQHLTQIMLEKSSFCDLHRHLDMAGRTVLHHAAINDWPSIIEQILNSPSGRSILDNIDHSGSSATHQAALLGHTRCVKVFLERSASLRLQDRNGRTAAHAAADAGFKGTLALLLDIGDLDPNQRDHQGRNLAHWVASIDCVDIMETIVRKWPDVDLLRKDNMFLLPIDIARVCECPNVGKFLQIEMQRRGGDPWLLKTYRWDNMYCSPTVEFVEEDLSVTYQRTREKLEQAAQKDRWEDWQEVHDQYPEHLWALVGKSHMDLWEEMRDVRAEIAVTRKRISAISKRSSSSRLVTIQHDLGEIRTRLREIEDDMERAPGTESRFNKVPSRVAILSAEVKAVNADLDILGLERDASGRQDDITKRLHRLRSKLDKLRTKIDEKKIKKYKIDDHLHALVDEELPAILEEIDKIKEI